MKFSTVDQYNDTYYYKNLYLLNEKFYFLSPIPINLPSTALSVGYLQKKVYEKRETKWKPIVINSLNNLDTIYIKDIVYFNEDEVPNHIGHTLFDSIASQFAALKQCNIVLNEISVILTLQNLKYYEKKYHDVKSSYELLFGKPKIYLDELCQQYKDKIVCFKTFIVGSGNKGVSSYDHTYKAINGYENCWSEFRNYCYLRSGLNDNNTNTKITFASTDKNERKDRIIANDKDICKIISNMTNGLIIRWPELNTFKEQIKVMCETKIYISIDGTAGLNAILLPDNAIYINLGIFKGSEKLVSYMDDYVYSACNFKVIYYHDNIEYNYLNTSQILINTDFLLKIIYNYSVYFSKENYSNYGLQLLDILKRIPLNQQKQIIFNLRITKLAEGCSHYMKNNINIMMLLNSINPLLIEDMYSVLT
jgi:hypothetical protein